MVFGKDTVEKVLPLLRILTLELEKDGFYSVMKLFILLHELSKCDDLRELSSTTHSLLSRNDLLMNQLQQYIIHHLHQDVSLPAVADSLNMSKSTFARFLKGATGMNYTDYLLNLRINMAIRMLKEEVSIPDIVEECGFNSVSYFYRVFKKMKGIPPQEYRNRFKKQKKIV